ncbi:hypothetical protein Zm00014a_015382 [Zea mays]|uniref:DUF740 family protein n=2 Tax=Zea mays TaxID=4577 RepID=B6TIQ0_MAIZE|nr:uncharacterized protein LOC100276810 isoform 1 [Zea mays]ACG36983.1 hypothetical protein [Zea mays]ONM15643.1 DUF740 family protein [Zea mays]PWZ38984.1 hypothetical protein Zm00014a_015382 [Zea mays]|eukprot:NP_001143992.1 uncharacterized protein LOC100276810 [Zea mays]
MNKQQQAYGYGNGQQADVPGYCCFHPREVGVGVCAHCLKDRLLLLLAAANNNKIDDDARRKSRSRSRSISLPKVFALGSSFLQRLDSRHHRGRGRDNNCYSDDDDATASVASLDDSFISIKFEDNGKATWDSQSQHKAAAPARSSSTTTMVAVEHVKRVGVTRWRKQVVGRMLQLARWRRSSAAAGGLDGKKAAAAAAERSKARGRGWIRSLTRRRAHGDRAW